MEQGKKADSVSLGEFPPSTYEQWKQEAIASLKGGDFDKKLLTETVEGITLRPIYTADDVPEAQRDAYPGEGSLLRGADASGYLGESWQIAQVIDASAPAEAAALVLDELMNGCDTVNLSLAPSSLIGEEPREGERGLVLQDREDVRTAVDQVRTDIAGLHIGCGASALPLLAALFSLGKLNGASGMVGADPLGALAVLGRLPRPAALLYDEMAEAIRFTRRVAPRLRAVHIDGTVYAAAGANAAQEVACCLGAAAAYISEMLDRGLALDEVLGSIRFTLSLGSDFFMEVSKLRAGRMAYAQLTEAFGQKAEMEVFAATGSFTKSIYDPYVNILRATTEAFSGVVGGARGIAVAPLDEARDTGESLPRRIARNIQVMLKEEFSLTQPVDPAGGSWYVESLSMQLGEKIWQLFQQIEQRGGMLSALSSGWVQEQIGHALSQRLFKLDTRKDRAVGINMYVNTEEKPFVPDQGRRAVKAKVPALTGEEELFAALSGARGEKIHLIKALLDQGATFAQISGAMNAGEGEQAQPLAPHRRAERFEALRARTEAYEQRTGDTAKALLLCMGDPAALKARMDFVQDFFGPGKFTLIRSDRIDDPQEAARLAGDLSPDLCVICGSDDSYPELVPGLTRLLKSVKPRMMVMVAGAPAVEHKESYLAAGVDEFVHLRANCHDIIAKVQEERGIR